ncbi:MAG TPA: HAD family hydrolase [Gammaproteobacteria bacterium]|nr:HAD family hydrolase [Gammaproteobacteria bacterium]
MDESPSTSTAAVEAVLFDLDGTLADTAPDLAHALNAVRAEQDLSPLPFEAIRPRVSHGATALIRLGFGLSPGDRDFEPLRQRLLAIYRDQLTRHTRLFPGMAGLLDELEGRAIPWGVVTNKPAWLTEPLLAGLGLAERAACIVSGDSTARRKPDPEPMLHASRLLERSPSACLYVGDARRDIEAGRRAGMRTLVALFGYLDADDRPADWQADGLVHHPAEILSWVGT